MTLEEACKIVAPLPEGFEGIRHTAPVASGADAKGVGAPADARRAPEEVASGKIVSIPPLKQDQKDYLAKALAPAKPVDMSVVIGGPRASSQGQNREAALISDLLRLAAVEGECGPWFHHNAVRDKLAEAASLIRSLSAALAEQASSPAAEDERDGPGMHTNTPASPSNITSES